MQSLEQRTRIAAATREDFLIIEVTTRCNLDCPYCFALADLPARVGMSFEMARSAVDEGYEIGYRHLHLSGGEPTLWKHFADLIDYAFARGYAEVWFNTNGMLLTKRLCERLATHTGRVSCSISLNGPHELHEASRGADTFEPTIRGIELALAHGIGVDLFTTVHRPLLPVFGEFVRFVFDRFPDALRLTLIQLHRVQNDYYDVSADLLSDEDFVTLVRHAGILALRYPIRFLDNPLAGVLAARMGLSWVWSTPFLRPGRLVLLANGDITPGHSARLVLGRYAPGRLREIQASAEYGALVASDDTLCSTCDYIAACRSGGLLRPSDKLRDHRDDVPFCVRTNQLVSAGIARD